MASRLSVSFTQYTCPLRPSNMQAGYLVAQRTPPSQSVPYETPNKPYSPPLPSFFIHRHNSILATRMRLLTAPIHTSSFFAVSTSHQETTTKTRIHLYTDYRFTIVCFPHSLCMERWQSGLMQRS